MEWEFDSSNIKRTFIHFSEDISRLALSLRCGTQSEPGASSSGQEPQKIQSEPGASLSGQELQKLPRRLSQKERRRNQWRRAIIALEHHGLGIMQMEPQPLRAGQSIPVPISTPLQMGPRSKFIWFAIGNVLCVLIYALLDENPLPLYAPTLTPSLSVAMMLGCAAALVLDMKTKGTGITKAKLIYLGLLLEHVSFSFGPVPVEVGIASFNLCFLGGLLALAVPVLEYAWLLAPLAFRWLAPMLVFLVDWVGYDIMIALISGAAEVPRDLRFMTGDVNGFIADALIFAMVLLRRKQILKWTSINSKVLMLYKLLWEFYSILHGKSVTMEIPEACGRLLVIAYMTHSLIRPRRCDISLIILSLVTVQVGLFQVQIRLVTVQIGLIILLWKRILATLLLIGMLA